MTASQALRAAVRAQERLDKAQAEFDAALVRAADPELHNPSEDLFSALGLKPATYFRRLRRARTQVAVQAKPSRRVFLDVDSDPRHREL